MKKYLLLLVFIILLLSACEQNPDVEIDFNKNEIFSFKVGDDLNFPTIYAYDDQENEIEVEIDTSSIKDEEGVYYVKLIAVKNDTRVIQYNTVVMYNPIYATDAVFLNELVDDIPALSEEDSLQVMITYYNPMAYDITEIHVSNNRYRGNEITQNQDGNFTNVTVDLGSRNNTSTPGENAFLLTVDWLTYELYKDVYYAELPDYSKNMTYFYIAPEVEEILE